LRVVKDVSNYRVCFGCGEYCETKRVAGVDVCQECAEDRPLVEDGEGDPDWHQHVCEMCHSASSDLRLRWVPHLAETLPICPGCADKHCRPHRYDEYPDEDN
jgi:hypothetical protein